MDNYGPDAQRDVISRAIANRGWHATGIEYLVAHSGRTVHRTPIWSQMLAAAGRDWDVLVVGRTNRLSRNVRSQIEAVEAIRKAGGDVYFVREDVQTSDPRHWKKWMDETVMAEAYSRTLSTDVTEGILMKVLRTGIPWNDAPFGYNADWTIDEPRAAIVRQVFADYVLGTVSLDELADRYALAPEHTREIIKNPSYAGHATVRGKIVRDGAFTAIVDRETFDQARQVAQTRRRAG